MITRLCKSLALGAAIFVAQTASAAVVIDPQPFNNPDPTPQIHNTGNQSGTTVQGVTVGGGYLYNFTSSSTLSINGAGHATVQGPWHKLTMTPNNPLFSFSAIDFNLNVSGVNGNNPFYANVVLDLLGGGTASFNNLSLGNGQNKYLIFGNAGEKFTAITFTGWGNQANTVARSFTDIRQIDVDTVAPVPEPASWAIMLIGFGFIGGAMRRKRLTIAHA